MSALIVNEAAEEECREDSETFEDIETLAGKTTCLPDFSYVSIFATLLFLILNTYIRSVQDIKGADTAVVRLETSPALSEKGSSNATSVQEKLPAHIKACVPFYNLIDEHVKLRAEDRKQPETTMSLVAAYAFPDYSVVTTEADGWFGRKVFCHYYDKHWIELCNPVKSVVFPEFTVYCCRNSNAVYMGISEDKGKEAVSTVTVLDRTVDNPKYKLSLCLAPMYGRESKWLMLTELVEHYKLQGVEHFYLYIKDIDSYSKRVIDDYVKTGEAEAVFFREQQDRPGKEWQLAGVQDCLHRSRHQSRYSIFADLDERIMATGQETLADVVVQLMNENPNSAVIHFQIALVLRTCEPPTKYEGDVTLRNHLPTLVFRNMSAPLRPEQSAKCVVDTKRVFVMWVHFPMANFNGYVRTHATPDKAIIRHYRYYTGEESMARMMYRAKREGNFTITDYPEHLMRYLYPNVKKRLNRVYRKI